MSEDDILDNLKKDPKYKSFGEFLKATPKNLWGAIISTLVTVAMLIGSILTRHSLDPQWTIYPIVGFCCLIIFLSWHRVYHIYKNPD
jgi:hypothetical protein